MDFIVANRFIYLGLYNREECEVYRAIEDRRNAPRHGHTWVLSVTVEKQPAQRTPPRLSGEQQQQQQRRATGVTDPRQQTEGVFVWG